VPSVKPTPKKAPKSSPSATTEATEAPPAVEPALPEPTPSIPSVPKVTPPKFQPLDNGFSFLNLSRALWGLGAFVLIVGLAAGIFIVRHAKRRNTQTKLESRLYQAVQEMKDNTKRMGSDTNWTRLGT